MKILERIRPCSDAGVLIRKTEKPKNRPYYCDSIGHLKSYYLQGNVSDVDVAVFMQEFFGYGLEEAQKATFGWRYGGK